MSHVQKALDRYLYAGFIYDFKLDIISHTLSFRENLYSLKGTKNYKVEISEISFFLFYDSYAKETKNYKKWEDVQVLHFFYEPADKPEEKEYKLLMERDKKRKDFNRDFNLNLDLNDRALFIKAGRLKINDEEFELK